MKNTSDGRRKARVEKEVQEVVSNFVIHNIKHELPGVVTVTRVQMPADFRHATIFITYFSVIDNDKADAVKILQYWATDIQDQIAHVLKLRYCPKLTFRNDETTEKILKIEKILSDIAVEPDTTKDLNEDVD
jgi:ribosome-binding factor A